MQNNWRAFCPIEDLGEALSCQQSFTCLHLELVGEVDEEVDEEVDMEVENEMDKEVDEEVDKEVDKEVNNVGVDKERRCLATIFHTPPFGLNCDG